MTFCSASCAEGKPAAEHKVGPAVAAQPTAMAAPTPAAQRHQAAVIDDDVRSVARTGSRRSKIIAVSGLFVVGGMGVAIFEAVSPSSPSRVDAASERPRDKPPANPTETPESPAAASPPALDAKSLFARAESVLRELMQANSPRLRRVAASALARIGDKAALQVLGESLAAEPSEIGRVEIAYALARGGSELGTATLEKALAHTRRDVRLDASRALIQLKDPAGTKYLRSILDLKTHRIGAAEALAKLKDEQGLKALREVRDDKSSTDENRMRATVALGLAGDASVTEELKTILTDGRFNIGAAWALAALGDKAAIAPLEKQLLMPSMRVAAATWLRRIGYGPDLRVLADALETEADVGRANVAEAILLLAGPAVVAEYD